MQPTLNPRASNAREIVGHHLDNIIRQALESMPVQAAALPERYMPSDAPEVVYDADTVRDLAELTQELKALQRRKSTSTSPTERGHLKTEITRVQKLIDGLAREILKK